MPPRSIALVNTCSVVGWRFTHLGTSTVVRNGRNARPSKGIGKRSTCWASVYHCRGDFQRAFQWYSTAADQGDIRAMAVLGELYMGRMGIPPDLDDEAAKARGFALVEEAARRGDPYGRYVLGRVLLGLKDEPTGVIRGLEVLSRSAAEGNTLSMLLLIEIYSTGYRLERPDHDLARHWACAYAATEGRVLGHQIMSPEETRQSAADHLRAFSGIAELDCGS